MSVILIRHGKTAGNLEGRYIGARTDESLCAAGVQELKARSFPKAARVFISPMKRCLETARLIYPDVEPIIVDDFRETDFGLFEGHNYAELNGRSDYQAWIDSGGEAPFPGGESRRDMCERCIKAFNRLKLFDRQYDSALIVHGGTIMAIMSAFARPERSYFDYRVKNGEGFILNGDGSWHCI